MVAWQDAAWQYFLRELKSYPTHKSYKLNRQDGFVFLVIDNDESHTYVFDMSGYAGETSEEIAKNMAEDMAENYL